MTKKNLVPIIPVELQLQFEAETTQKQLAIGNAVLRFLALDDFLGENLKTLSGVWIPSAHRDSYPTEDLAGFLNQSYRSTQVAQDISKIQGAIVAIIKNASQFAEDSNLQYIFDPNFVGDNIDLLLDIPLDIISKFDKKVLIQYISFLVSLEDKMKEKIDSSTGKNLEEKVTDKLRAIVEVVPLQDDYLLICLFQLYIRNDVGFLDNYLNQEKVSEKKELFIGLVSDTERFTDEFRSYIQSKVLAI